MSTVELNIYQKQESRSRVVAHLEKAMGYGSSIGYEIKNSIKFGWAMIEVIFVFILKLWALILIAGILYFGIKKIIFNKK
jgi:hypothetical protein